MYFGIVTQPAAWHLGPSKEWNVVQGKRIMFNSAFYGLNKTMKMTFFSPVNLATEEVKNWNLSMEDFKHLKDASVNSIWKWNISLILFTWSIYGMWSHMIFQFRSLTIETKRLVCKSSKVMHNVTMGMFSSRVFQKFKKTFLATKNNSTG